MPALTAEYVTDPLSPWCWAAQPTLRRLAFERDLVPTPRLVPLLPDTARADLLPAGVTPETLGEAFAAAVRGSGMPVADDLWADRAPASSWPACAAVAVVREAAPDRVQPYLHRVREAAFADGEPLDDPARLADLARAVGGIDADALEAAVAGGDAAAALGGDLERARELARSLDGGASVRGEVGVLPAWPRRADGTVPDPPAAPDDASGDDDAPAAGDDTPAPGEGDEPAEAEEGADDDWLLAPPALWFEHDGEVVVANPAVGFNRLAAVTGDAVPRSVAELSEKYGTGRLAVHVSQELAESLSSRDFLPEVRAYVERFDRTFLAEVAAGTGFSPATCQSGLERLAADGVVEATDDEGRGWRTIDGRGTGR